MLNQRNRKPKVDCLQTRLIGKPLGHDLGKNIKYNHSVAMEKMNLSTLTASTNSIWHFSGHLWCTKWIQSHVKFFFQNCLIFPGLTVFIVLKNCISWTRKNQSIFEEKFYMALKSFSASGESRKIPHWVCRGYKCGEIFFRQFRTALWGKHY